MEENRVKQMTGAATVSDFNGLTLNRCYGVVFSLTFLAGLASQVYIPLPDVQVYFLECAFFSALIICDAILRRATFSQTLMYTAAALVMAPLAVPHWYANRPLKPGEVRKGGGDVNFLNAFAIVTVMFTGVSAACSFLSFGSEHGFELIINAGFCVAGTALVAGLITRKERVLETGVKRLPKNAESEIGE
jgi:hypothetical protein